MSVALCIQFVVFHLSTNFSPSLSLTHTNIFHFMFFSFVSVYFFSSLFVDFLFLVETAALVSICVQFKSKWSRKETGIENHFNFVLFLSRVRAFFFICTLHFFLFLSLYFSFKFCFSCVCVWILYANKQTNERREREKKAFNLIFRVDFSTESIRLAIKRAWAL